MINAYWQQEKNILVAGQGRTQELDDCLIGDKTKYSISCKESGKRFVLSLNCSGSSRFFFVIADRIYQFKANDSEVKQYIIYIYTLDSTANNMRNYDQMVACTIFLLITVLLMLMILSTFINISWKNTISDNVWIY